NCQGAIAYPARRLQRGRFHKPLSTSRQQSPVPRARDNLRRPRFRAAWLRRTSRILPGSPSRANQRARPNSSELLGSGGEGCTEMPDLVFHVGRVGERVRDFIAQQRSVTLPHIVQLFFYRALANPQGSRKIGV